MATTTEVNAAIRLEFKQTQTPYAGDSGLRKAGRSDGTPRSYAATADATCYVASITIAASGNQSFDLSGSTIKDLHGSDAVFTNIKEILIVNRSDNPPDGSAATVGEAAITGNWITSTYGASTSIPLCPGGKFYHSDPDGLTVTNSSADTITITETTTTDALDIEIQLYGDNS